MDEQEIKDIQFEEIIRLKGIIGKLVEAIESHEVPVDLMVKAKKAAE